MTQYKVIEKDSSKKLVFENEPEKYAVIVEKPENGEEIILPTEKESKNTYYVEKTGEEPDLVFKPEDNIKEVITS